MGDCGARYKSRSSLRLHRQECEHVSRGVGAVRISKNKATDDTPKDGTHSNHNGADAEIRIQPNADNGQLGPPSSDEEVPVKDIAIHVPSNPVLQDAHFSNTIIDR